MVSVPQKTVRNMRSKDNVGTLQINVYAQVQPTITPLDFSKIAEDGQDGARTTAHHDSSHKILYTVPWEMLFSLHLTPHLGGQWYTYYKKASLPRQKKNKNARLFEGDPFNPLIFYTEGVVEINDTDLGDSLEKTVTGNGNIELTEN